jgi:hypothetical protein
MTTERPQSLRQRLQSLLFQQDDNAASPCTATEHANALPTALHLHACTIPADDAASSLAAYEHEGEFLDSASEDDGEVAVADGRHDDNHLTPEAESLYCSICLLLWGANLESAEVETIIGEAVGEHLRDSDQIIQSLEEICYPFFFAKRPDSTKWEPRNLIQVMQNFVWYDWFRQQVLHKHGHSAMDRMLSEAEASECWKLYRDWFEKYELQPHQQKDCVTSYMAARFHSDVGSRFAVYATWKFGLPTIAEPLRKACITQAMLQSALTAEDRCSLQQHVKQCIAWFRYVAHDVEQRKITPRYHEEKRKSGRWKQTGLNAAELAAKQDKEQQRWFRW